NDQSTRGVGDKQRVAELMQQFKACYEEGKYKEAERYALAACELDPDNAAARAAVEIAGIQRRRAEPQRLKEREEEIVHLLQQPVNVNFRDVPLGQVLDELRARYGLNLAVDQPALERANISLKRPVTVHLDHLSLKSALTL